MTSELAMCLSFSPKYGIPDVPRTSDEKTSSLVVSFIFTKVVLEGRLPLTIFLKKTDLVL